MATQSKAMTIGRFCERRLTMYPSSPWFAMTSGGVAWRAQRSGHQKRC